MSKGMLIVGIILLAIITFGVVNTTKPNSVWERLKNL